MTLNNDNDNDALASLRETRARISEQAAKLEEELRAAVFEARKSGATWKQVGEAMGLTKQGAWEKFASSGDVDDVEQVAPPKPAKERRRMVRDYTDEDNVVVRIVGRREAPPTRRTNA
jgi:hypothetical protein